MGSIERRLTRLEKDLSREDPPDDAARREILSRMSDAELRSYRDALRRAVSNQGRFAAEDTPILKRATELYKELRNEHATTN